MTALEEEKAYLDALARGYGDAGMDVSAQHQSIAEIDQRLGELKDQLRKEGINHQYTPRDRGVIGPSQEMLAMGREWT